MNRNLMIMFNEMQVSCPKCKAICINELFSEHQCPDVFKALIKKLEEENLKLKEKV